MHNYCNNHSLGQPQCDHAGPQAVYQPALKEVWHMAEAKADSPKAKEGGCRQMASPRQEARKVKSSHAQM